VGIGSASKLRRFVRLTWPVGAVLLVAGALAWWILGWNPTRRRTAEPDAEPTVTAEQGPSWAPRQQHAPEPGCTPEASTTCVDGDVWWVDSCGDTYALAIECGARRCDQGACEEGSPGGCGEVTALGQCTRDVARICQLDRVMEIDCRLQGRRCVMTPEGPLCREKTPDDCRAGDRPQCRGTSLRTCLDGRWTSYDCDALGGICAPGRGGSPPRCVFAMPKLDGDCTACECPADAKPEECNGKDDDLDGAIDEDVECPPVPVVAAVIVDTDGKGSYTDDDIAAAIDELNGSFVRDDGYGLRFELLQVVRLAEPTWLELDMNDVDQMLRRGVLELGHDEFYVPVVFTDVVLAEQVPRPGLATVPNGMCGGQRRSWGPQPPVGLVAVAKLRWPTTLAHEMGHFLGLCHTHEAPPPVEQVAAGTDGELADAPVCEDGCAGDPDGLCDTAIDPGPEMCGVDAECSIHCETGDRPDARNMMAYYPPCRTLFSEAQALLMRHSLALRRGWHACVSNEGCVCNPERQDCPESMTCRAYDVSGQAQWRCDLDGPALPGGRCDDGSECGRGSICVHTPLGEGRCARTCDPSDPPCRCEPITTPQVAVCSEDLRMSDAG